MRELIQRWTSVGRRDISRTDDIEIIFGRPLFLMAKPAGSSCNLRCSYCYYLEKSGLYQGSSQLMDEETLELFIKEYIESQTTPEVMFIWHGGEPMLRPIAFYQRAIELQQRYANGRRIDNCIQTNATLITDEWCKFLSRNNFLVGVSIDGPRQMHDALRKTHQDDGSYGDVIRGIRLLTKYHIEWNAMATVNAVNVKHPLEFYRFFRDELECRYLQFTPVVERTDTSNGSHRLMHGAESNGTITPYSVTAKQWGELIFDTQCKSLPNKTC